MLIRLAAAMPAVVATFVTAAEVLCMDYSEFVPPAHEKRWEISCFRVPGWGTDPDAHDPGSSKLWAPTLRVESRDFALVSSRRANRALHNEPAPYWPMSSFLWFRCGEAEVPHSISASWREDGSATSDNQVYACGEYYVSRVSEDKVACGMQGGAGRREASDGLPSFRQWPKMEITWRYLLDAGAGSAVIQLTAKNTSGKKLSDVNLKLAFYVGPECGCVRTRQANSEEWIAAMSAATELKAISLCCEGLKSGVAVITDNSGSIELSPDTGLRKGWNAIVHFRAATIEPEESMIGRALVKALMGDRPELPVGLDVPSDDLAALPYAIERCPVRFLSGKSDIEPREFSLEQWLKELDRPKIRGVAHQNRDLEATKRRIKEYGEIRQNCMIAPFDAKASEEFVRQCKEAGLKQVWVAGRAAGFKYLPRAAQPDGYGADVDAPLWSPFRDPSQFAEKYGYDITKAGRESLVRYYSWGFAESWRQFSAQTTAVVPDALTWFYGQLHYQAYRYPLNTDAMCRIYCEELAKVPDIHLIYFYYGIDNGSIENQVRIAKGANVPRVYVMPMSYFCYEPGVITGNLAAGQKAGADGAFFFDADATTGWQLCEWGLASRTYFPTSELPAFLLTWDMKGLITAIRGAEDIRIDDFGLSPDDTRMVEALRSLLRKRAPLDGRQREGAITIHVGQPGAIGKAGIVAKAKETLSACTDAGISEDRGYVLPSARTIWVGGANSIACARAMGLMLQIARMASFGRDAAPYPYEEYDGAPYP